MPLTDTAIRNAKLRDKSYKLSDGGGLHLLVGTEGSKYLHIGISESKRLSLSGFTPPLRLPMLG
jgi:hypothetical protein